MSLVVATSKVRKQSVAGGGGVAVKRQQQRSAIAIQQPKSSSTSSSNIKYKTEYCHSVYTSVACKYGDICQFAHTQEELRNRAHHMKYKTIDCKSFHTVGACPYGHKCDFRHNEPLPTDIGGSGVDNNVSPTPRRSYGKYPTTPTLSGLKISVGGGGSSPPVYPQAIYWPASPADSSSGNYSASGESPAPSSLCSNHGSSCGNADSSSSPSPDPWELSAGSVGEVFGGVWSTPSSMVSPAHSVSPLPKLALSPDYASYQQRQHPFQHQHEQQHRYCYQQRQNPVDLQSYLLQTGGGNNSAASAYNGFAVIRCQ